METYLFIYDGDYVSVVGDYHNISSISENLGDSWDDYLNGKYILLNEAQIQYLNSNIGVSPKEVFFMEPSDEISTLVKNALIKKINEYASSDKVKSFSINGESTWLNKKDRTSLSYSLSLEKEAGNEFTTLWINNTPYVLKIEEAKQMLKEVELYAVACHNNTQNNISLILSAGSKSELGDFDITQGYPEQLNFNL